MNMKPILFNTEMVRAILDGRKAVTQRVLKLEYSNTHLEMFTNKYGTRLIEKQNFEPGSTIVKNPDGSTMRKLLACIEKTPPYHPGNILYVRETWERAWKNRSEFEYIYKANVHTQDPLPIKWHPSTHMPKEAARLFLQVTDVRVDRLQKMTNDDFVCDFGVCREAIQAVGRDALAIPFWDSTIKPADHALYGWVANPWVWVIKFERCRKHMKTKITKQLTDKQSTSRPSLNSTR